MQRMTELYRPYTLQPRASTLGSGLLGIQIEFQSSVI